MSGQKSLVITLGFVLSASLIASALAVMLMSCHGSKLQYDLLNAVCGEIAEQEQEAGQIISAVLKEYTGGNAGDRAERSFLAELGYCSSDFRNADYRFWALCVMAGFLAGAFLFVMTVLYRNKTETARIQALAEYLEQVNMGKAVVLSSSGEDRFSQLEDEIYKTVTFLYQTKDTAVRAKNKFAENLSNIAHQIKTPITAISLSVQTMKQNYDERYLEQIQRQLLRLTHLEEALLVLSRLDAGTLTLQKEEIDVYTVLVLAADNLQELLIQYGVCVDLPELGEMAIYADLDWTMEAVINLMKNCMEHSAGKTIHCSYGQNPLYTEILICDEGQGFAREDIPHLFERFYRGQNAREGGIGIGLALAKEIIERQNGTIRAKNMPEGGACFEIRFYSH